MRKKTHSPLKTWQFNNTINPYKSLQIISKKPGTNYLVMSLIFL